MVYFLCFFPASTLAASSAGAPCHFRQVATATLQLCASRNTLWNSLLLFNSYLRRFQLQEHHDISVIGYGDILPERFEETPSMATVALCALRITFSAFASLTSCALRGIRLQHSHPIFSFTTTLAPSSGAPSHLRPLAMPTSSLCASRSTSLATTTSSLCASRSTCSVFPSLLRSPHFAASIY